MGEKIGDIARSVGLDEKDIKTMKRRRIIEKISIPVSGLIISILSYMVGHAMGTRAEPREVITNQDSYPYAGIGMIAGIGFLSRNKLLIAIVLILTVGLSIIAYIQGYEAGRPYYELAIAYGVYDSSGSLDQVKLI